MSVEPATFDSREEKLRFPSHERYIKKLELPEQFNVTSACRVPFHGTQPVLLTRQRSILSSTLVREAELRGFAFTSGAWE